MIDFFHAARRAASCAIVVFAVSAMAAPALAQDILVPAKPSADDHAPAGVPADHIHKAGDVMIGLSLSRQESKGAMRSGTEALTDTQVASAGYSMGIQSMRMDMAMLDLMWAPSNRLTLMVMPSYMRMDMTMRALPTMGGMTGMAGMMDMMPGATHAHSYAGWGDTIVAGLIRIGQTDKMSIHATLGVSIPTGTADARNADGSFMGYGMQTGSGTWDILPSLTVTGRAGRFGWGGQAAWVWRAEDRNASGYRLGNRLTGTVWGSYRLLKSVSLSLRGLYTHDGAIRGTYVGMVDDSDPSDLPVNYGGDRLDLGLGLNLVAVGGPLRGIRLGAEYLTPLYQKVNGIQLPVHNGLQLNLSKAF